MGFTRHISDASLTFCKDFPKDWTYDPCSRISFNETPSVFCFGSNGTYGGNLFPDNIINSTVAQGQRNGCFSDDTCSLSISISTTVVDKYTKALGGLFQLRTKIKRTALKQSIQRSYVIDIEKSSGSKRDKEGRRMKPMYDMPFDSTPFYATDALVIHHDMSYQPGIYPHELALHVHHSCHFTFLTPRLIDFWENNILMNKTNLTSDRTFYEFHDWKNNPPNILRLNNCSVFCEKDSEDATLYINFLMNSTWPSSDPVNLLSEEANLTYMQIIRSDLGFFSVPQREADKPNRKVLWKEFPMEFVFMSKPEVIVKPIEIKVEEEPTKPPPPVHHTILYRILYGVLVLIGMTLIICIWSLTWKKQKEHVDYDDQELIEAKAHRTLGLIHQELQTRYRYQKPPSAYSVFELIE